MNGEEQIGAWSMLEQAMTPGMPSLQDLDPEMVANKANQDAFAEQPVLPSDLRRQAATMIQQEALQKSARSAEFQARAQMMNRSQGK